MSDSGTKLEDFDLNTLMLFIIGILGSLGGCLGGLCVVIQKSKCSKISICGMGCERDVNAVIQEERLSMTGHTGLTPEAVKSNKPINKKNNLDLILQDTNTTKNIKK